jgi:hypothetical protein
MSPNRIVPFVADVYQGMHAKRLRTLSLLMLALVTVGKVGVAALGRSLASRAAPKHCIKQVDRFLSNTGIAVHEWCKLLLASVVGERREVRIAIDWTKVGKWPVLVASVVVQRRGIPIYWATCDYRTLARSQNAFEESFLAVLKDMMPEDLSVTLLFDRGFRRVSLVKALKRLRFHFVVRCCDDIYVNGKDYKGQLADLPLPRGVTRDLGMVEATVAHPEEVRIVALFDHGHKEAWYLFTDLDLHASDIVKAYGRRFTIEEVFRDGKSTRYGWSLREFQVKDRTDRLDRMILVLASAYFLVTLIGLAVETKGLDRKFRANTVKTRKTHSLFQLGWKGWRLVRWLLDSWWRLFWDHSFELPLNPTATTVGGAR